MRLPVFGSAVFGIVGIVALSTALARADSDACWQVVYHAIERSAAAPHAAFTHYNERGSIVQDGTVLQRETIDVLYRDDGLALIDDSRWTYPLVSNALEPGPPVLGPYGSRRNIWLALDDTELPYPVIGDVHTHPQTMCTMHTEMYAGAPALRIDLPDAPKDRPGLHSLWLDPETQAVRKVIVLGLLQFRGPDPTGQPHFAPFEVEFQQEGAYTVVRHVTWKFDLHFYSQTSSLFGEYYYDRYTFPEHPASSSLGMQ